MNKSFLILLVLVIFLGAGFGGSFVGGVIYGQGLEDESESPLSPRLESSQFSGGFATEGAGQRGQGRRGQGATTGAGQEESADTAAGAPPADRQPRPGRETQGAADVSAESVDERGPGVVGTPAQPPARGAGAASTETVSPAGVTSPAGEPGPSSGGSGRGGIVGTIQGLEGDSMTVTSARGDLSVRISDFTMVFEVTEVTSDALATGSGVRIVGTRNEEGEIAAQSVVIVPEAADNLFGAAGGPGGRRRGQ